VHNFRYECADSYQAFCYILLKPENQELEKRLTTEEISLIKKKRQRLLTYFTNVMNGKHARPRRMTSSSHR